LLIMSTKRNSGRIYKIDKIVRLAGNIRGLSCFAGSAGGRGRRKDIRGPGRGDVEKSGRGRPFEALRLRVRTRAASAGGLWAWKTAARRAFGLALRARDRLPHHPVFLSAIHHRVETVGCWRQTSRRFRNQPARPVPTLASRTAPGAGMGAEPTTSIA